MGGVALNALALTPDGSGVQTYIRELLAGVQRVAPGLALRARVQGDVTGQLPPGIEIDRSPASAGMRRVVAGLRPFEGAAVVHGLDVDLPLRQRTPCAITVHDLSVYDTAWAFSRRRVGAERMLLARSVRRADAILAVSPFTAQRIHERFGRTAVVTPLAPSPDMVPPAPGRVADVRARLSLPDRFVIQVGTVEPRKDTALLAQACTDLGLPLFLAGAVRGPVPAGAQVLGYVSRDDLPSLYAAATVVAYLSVYEGFGLPPVEAMACGAAVVASRVGALPDIAGLGRGLVAPGDLAGLTTLLRELWHDDEARRALAAEGEAAAASLRWDDTARATVAVWHDLGARDELVA